MLRNIATVPSIGPTSVVAANILQTIWSRCGGSLERPFNHMLQVVETPRYRFSKLSREDAAFAEWQLSLLEEMRTLDDWINKWPFSWNRYLAIRQKPPGDPLCGFHRGLWRDIDLSIEGKHSILELAEEFPDNAGDPQKLAEYKNEHIMPPGDGYFLRKSNPATTGKLVFYQLFLHHELDLQYANFGCELFFMCHLYNGLQQSGHLNNSWQAIEDVTELHIKEIFLGKRPTSAEMLVSRLLLAAGFPSEAARLHRKVNHGRRESDITKTTTKKDSRLELPPMMSIFADHVHDREPLIRTLYRADTEMVMQASRTSRKQGSNSSAAPRTKKQPIKSFIDDPGPLAFLKQLQKHSQIFDRCFSTDYVEMTRICQTLFQKILTAEMLCAIREVGPLDAEELPVEAQEGACTMFILKQLAIADHLRESLPSSAVRRISAPFTERAASVLNEYIQAGATGIPT